MHSPVESSVGNIYQKREGLLCCNHFLLYRTHANRIMTLRIIPENNRKMYFVRLVTRIILFLNLLYSVLFLN